MWRYVVCGVIWLVVLAPAIRARLTSEILAHAGLSLLLSALVWGYIGPALRPGMWWARLAGLALFVPAGYLAIAGFLRLGRQALREEAALLGYRPEAPTLVCGGIYRGIRHPIFLGGALCCVAQMLISQSLVAFALGLPGALCFYLASRAEDAMNVAKFGQAYRDYASGVAGWNGVIRPGRRSRS